jgi:hypothetical protein
MGFCAIFNNISAISWRPVLLVEETTDLSQVTGRFYASLHNKNLNKLFGSVQSGHQYYLIEM